MVARQTSATNLKNKRALFWDIAEDTIERALAEYDEWVILRVFEYGELEDIFDVINLYTRERVVAVFTNARPKPMARAMAILFLDIEVSKFEERPLFYK